MPHEAERMREAHDREPEPERKPKQTQEATRMGYSMTIQLSPSMGGSGVTFVNKMVHQPQRSIADDMVDEARAELAREEAAMTPQQKLERDRQRDLEQTPDLSRGWDRSMWDDDPRR